MLTKVSFLTWNGRLAIPEFSTGGLEVASGLTTLGGEGGGRAESGGDEGGDDECGLHVDDLGVRDDLVETGGYRAKRRRCVVKW
jgi:hypothetical protein